jgi:hypothetical protein
MTARRSLNIWETLSFFNRAISYSNSESEHIIEAFFNAAEEIA